MKAYPATFLFPTTFSFCLYTALPFSLSTFVTAGAAAILHGSNSTFAWDDVAFTEVASRNVALNTLSASPFEELSATSGYEIKAPSNSLNRQDSWQSPLPTPSCSSSLPVRKLPFAKARITPVSDPEADFQPFNISLTGPFGETPGYRAAGCSFDLGLANDSVYFPPPKPPSLKSLGKCRWDASFDADNEDEDNSGFEGRLFGLNANLLADSDLSERWMKHLRSAISSAPEDEEPEDRSTWRSVYLTAPTGAALCLAATQSPDRKRKKARISVGESSATGAQQSQSRPEVSTSSDFSSCRASTSNLSGILSGKISEPRGLQESATGRSNSGSNCQPETRAISQEELVAEVKGIYAGLVMVEGKCVEIDSIPKTPQHLSNDGRKALIALHRVLLREHLEQFVATGGKSTPSEKTELTYWAEEGISNPGFEPSGSSQNIANGGRIGSLLDSLLFEHPENPFHSEIAALPDISESMPLRHLCPSFDVDPLSQSWDVSLSEKELIDPTSTEKALGDLINSTSGSGIESEEDWLRSFVDLGMCSDECSDTVLELATFSGFSSQNELPIPPGPVTYSEIGSYIEPHLIVMAQPDQKNNAPQELRVSSSSSPSEDIEESQSSPPSVLTSPPISQKEAPLLPRAMRDTSRRTGALRECHYCHKSFSPSDLK
jgi:hypothetical protein